MCAAISPDVIGSISVRRTTFAFIHIDILCPIGAEIFLFFMVCSTIGHKSVTCGAVAPFFTI